MVYFYLYGSNYLYSIITSSFREPWGNEGYFASWFDHRTAIPRFETSPLCTDFSVCEWVIPSNFRHFRKPSWIIHILVYVFIGVSHFRPKSSRVRNLRLATNALFCGMGVHLPVALEGALKLKAGTCGIVATVVERCWHMIYRCIG